MTSAAVVQQRWDRRVLLLSAGGVVALCWVLMFRDQAAHSAMAPHHHPAGPSGFALTFWMWMVMMVAMMLPPVLPWILFYAQVDRDHRRPGPPFFGAGMFAAGYFLVWGLFSAAAALTQGWLQQRDLLAGTMLNADAPVAGGLLLVAGVFQLTPLKSACLSHCRSPLGFFLQRWRDGPSGALGMGFRHGVYCLGCCWALMAVSFAVGVMNLLWMAVLTLFLCVEKIAPRGRVLGLVFGVALMVWGGWLLVS